MNHVNRPETESPPSTSPAQDPDLEALAGSLRRLAQRDPDVRQAVHALGRVLIRIAEEAESTCEAVEGEDGEGEKSCQPPVTGEDFEASAQVEAGPDASVSGASPTAAQSVSSAVQSAAPPISKPGPSGNELLHALINDPVSPATAASQPEVPGESELPPLDHIAARLSLKAEAATWAAERAERIDRGEYRPDRERLSDLQRRAEKLGDPGMLWMCRDQAPQTRADLWRALAQTAAATAEALTLVHEREQEDCPRGSAVRESFCLLAEAQSMLRSAVERRRDREDEDQANAFHWLRRQTRERHVFIERYMRLEDTADPAWAEELRDWLAALRQDWQHQRDARRRQREPLDRVRYHTRQLDDPDPERQAKHWQRIADSLDEVLAAGLPWSDPELRERVEALPTPWPQNVSVSERLQHALERLETSSKRAEGRGETPPVEPEPAPADETTEEVRRCAQALAGQRLVLIGGIRRPEHARKIEAAFNLEALDWLDPPEHASLEKFRPYIHRDRTAAVLLAIRWSSHSYGQVRQFCDEADVPLIRLPAGYHFTQIANQLITQAGQRLGA